MKKPFTRSALITFLATFLYAATSFGQTSITTGVLDPTTVCQGGTVDVPFTATGTIPALTTYEAQLSDATGVFGAAPTVVGSSNKSPIKATIPAATPAGAAYKIRVVSILAAVIKTEGTESAALKINAIPAAPTVTSPVKVDQGKTATLTATGTGLLWYDAETGGTGGATKPVPDTDTPGSKSYFVSQTVGTCESDRAEIVVTVIACMAPAKPTVSNKTYEVGDNAPVLSAVGTNLKWYENATGGPALGAAPKPSTTTAGTTKYYVTQTNASGCESERAEITVTVTDCTPPAKPTVSNKTYEVGDNAPVLTAVGTNLKWFENATGGPALASAPKPATTTAGTKKYYVSQTNASGCESERAEITVTVTDCTPPAKPTVSNKTYEVGDNAPVLTAVGTNLKWYENATGGPALGAAPKPSTTIPGTTKYYVSQTNATGCESPRAEITVTVTCKKFAGPKVSSPLAICQAPTDAAPLKATPLAKHTLLWYTSETGGKGSATAPTPSNTDAKSYSYFVSQLSETTGCESERVEIVVNVREAAKPTVKTPVEYCIGETATALTPSGSTFKWYSSLADVTGTTTAPKPATTTAATTAYYVTQSTTYGSLVCESSRVKLDVVVNPRPAALPTLSEALCQEREDKTFTFPTKATEGNKLKWYAAASGGTALTTAPSVNLKTSGETTYYVTQSSAKDCESTARAPQKIRVKPLPGLPTIEKPLIEYCQFVPAKPLEATPMAKAALNWFGTNASGGTSSDTPPTPSTAEGGQISYYVGQTLDGCLGDRAKIDVKINTTPKPATKTYLEYCQGETAPILDATGTVLKWYRTVDGEWQGVPFTPFTDKVQDYSFYVTQTGLENKCESPKEEIKIHIKSLPSATISGNSTIDLGGIANINLKFTGDGPWIFALSDGTTDTTDQANHHVSVSPSTTTSYLITEVSNACGKGVPLGSAMVTVKIPTINSGNPSVAEACAGKTFIVPFQQSGDFPAENSFKLQIASENQDSKFFTIPSVATRTAVTATFPDTTKAGNYYLRVISSGENPDFLVKGSVSSITISASPLPVATLSGPQTILVGEKATLKVETTGKAPWTFRLDNGTKDTLITAAVSPYTFQIAPPATVTYTITAVTNSCGTGKGAGSARVQVDPILGVEPQQPTDWVKVYPTLVQSVCTVEVTGTIKPKQASIEVIDLNGRSRGMRSIEQKSTDVDFSGYPSGLYLLRVQNGNLSTVQRVMKP